MRALIQRVSRASVSVDGRVVSEIGRGLVVLLGVGAEDGPQDAAALAAHTQAIGARAAEMRRMDE